MTTYYLEMTEPDELRPASKEFDNFEIERVSVPNPELSRSLYQSVGSQWKWTDRLPWTLERWREWVERDELQTWVARVDRESGGYFELELQGGRNVEIAYLGLLSNFIGRGFGGLLLTEAIRCAWAMGVARVWVHTCTLDHPRALANYKARGMRVYRVENGSPSFGIQSAEA